MEEFTALQRIAIWALPVIFAITVHEVAHGWMASRLGDPTAKMLGRLTLNPIKHIDPVGTLLIPGVLLMLGGVIFGWAKPVPVTSENFRHPRRDMAVVAAAGPIANIAMAILWAGVVKIGFVVGDSMIWLAQPLVYMGGAGITINVILAVLNLLPLPPSRWRTGSVGIVARQMVDSIRSHRTVRIFDHPDTAHDRHAGQNTYAAYRCVAENDLSGDGHLIILRDR